MCNQWNAERCLCECACVRAIVIYVCLAQMERGSECLHVCVSVSITNWVRKRIESTVTLANINGDWNGQEKSMQIWYVVRVWCVSVCLLCSCVFVPFAIEYVHMHIFMHTYTRTWHTRCSRILWLLYFLFCSYFFLLLFSSFSSSFHAFHLRPNAHFILTIVSQSIVNLARVTIHSVWETPEYCHR